METGTPPAAPDDDLSALRELRRGYHDRIAQLRDQTLALLEAASQAVDDATSILVDQDCSAGEELAAQLVDLAPAVASIDSEVLGLLALQAPVARDLRIILAARDIAQATALCIGLCQTLANRVAYSPEVLTGSLPAVIARIGSLTADVLRRAHGAWATLDEAQADLVISDAQVCRAAQQELLTELLRLKDVPMETGLNLGMATRAFGRLTDHAEEIAERVRFAVTGATPTFNRTGP